MNEHKGLVSIASGHRRAWLAGLGVALMVAVLSGCGVPVQGISGLGHDPEADARWLLGRWYMPPYDSEEFLPFVFDLSPVAAGSESGVDLTTSVEPSWLEFSETHAPDRLKDGIWLALSGTTPTMHTVTASGGAMLYSSKAIGEPDRIAVFALGGAGVQPHVYGAIERVGNAVVLYRLPASESAAELAHEMGLRVHIDRDRDTRPLIGGVSLSERRPSDGIGPVLPQHVAEERSIGKPMMQITAFLLLEGEARTREFVEAAWDLGYMIRVGVLVRQNYYPKPPRLRPGTVVDDWEPDEAMMRAVRRGVERFRRHHPEASRIWFQED